MKKAFLVFMSVVGLSGNLFAVEGYKEFKFGDAYGATVSKAKKFCPMGVDLGFGPHSYFQSYPHVCAPGIKMGGVDRNIFFFFESPPTPNDNPGRLQAVLIDLGKYTAKLYTTMGQALENKYGKPVEQPDKSDYRSFNSKSIFFLPTLYDKGTVSLLLIWFNTGVRVQLAYHPKKSGGKISSSKL